MHFLHTYHPSAVLLSLGFVSVHWYGLFMALALIAGLAVSLALSRRYQIKQDIIYDLFFYLIFFGLLGARLFYIFYNFNYFINHPWDIIKIWQGGIAIHGALVAGFLVLIWFARQLSLSHKKLPQHHQTNWFWFLAALIAPGVALGQAIGRWGNYFNQELFGVPTSMPWGIPIDLAHRPIDFATFTFFHPVFLYESLGSFLIFIILLILHVKAKSSRLIALSYVFLYAVLRLFMEFLRIDPTAGQLYGWRFTQIVNYGLLLFLGAYLINFNKHAILQKLLHLINK